MFLIGWPRWMLLAAAMVITATFLALPATQLGRRALLREISLPAVTTPAAALPPSSSRARACVTRRGLCSVGHVRAGDPCSCPYPLHGNMPGHVEPVGGPLARATHSRDWPSEAESEDPLFGP